MLTRVKVTVWYRLVIFPHMGRPATLHNLTVTIALVESKPRPTVWCEMFGCQCEGWPGQSGLSSGPALVSRCAGVARLAGRLRAELVSQCANHHQFFSSSVSRMILLPASRPAQHRGITSETSCLVDLISYGLIAWTEFQALHSI